MRVADKRERYSWMVTVSLLIGKLSLFVLRGSGLDDLAHEDEAVTPRQRFAMWLGRVGTRLGHAGAGWICLFCGRSLPGDPQADLRRHACGLYVEPIDSQVQGRARFRRCTLPANHEGDCA